MLWIYLSITENSVKKSIIKWIMMLFVSIVGFHIKAESVIMLIAIVIAHSIHIFVENRGVEIIKKLVPIILVLALVVPSFKLGSYSVIRTFENETGTEYDSEKSFSMFHWLMIGMNVESDGTFNGEDDTFSHYISDSEERESQNKKVIKQRLKEMGPSGCRHQGEWRGCRHREVGTLGGPALDWQGLLQNHIHCTRGVLSCRTGL